MQEVINLCYGGNDAKHIIVALAFAEIELQHHPQNLSEMCIRDRQMGEQFVTTTKHFRKLLAAGYLLIVLLVGGIICTWLGEWRDLELLDVYKRQPPTICLLRAATPLRCGTLLKESW